MQIIRGTESKSIRYTYDRVGTASQPKISVLQLFSRSDQENDALCITLRLIEMEYGLK